MMKMYGDRRVKYECIKYVEYCKMRIKTEPDVELCSQFAENCVEQLDSLKDATSAGFYDESGRAWTLSKREFKSGDIEIVVKCRENNVVRLAWIYPLSQKRPLENERGFPVYIGDWVVQVAF